MFLCLLSLALGFFLNEEASLKRICGGMSYQHEGWLVLSTRLGMVLFLACCASAFLKGYAWGLLLGDNVSCVEYLMPVCLYMTGNILAVRSVGGIFYTPWLALLGMILARNMMVVQFAFAVAVVYIMLTKKTTAGLYMGKIALCAALVFVFKWAEALLWVAVILAAQIFSNRQSPIRRVLIKYSGKISGWRVKT